MNVAPTHSDRLAGLSPVVAECPELLELLDVLGAVDRATARAVEVLRRLAVTGDVEAVTGLPVETWLSLAGRRTRSDRRMLQTTAEVFERMPTLAAAFDDGQISWAQTRTVVLACMRLPGHLQTAVDDHLADAIGDCADAEPDTLVHVVNRVLSSLDPGDGDKSEQAALRDRFLALQPRLDGTGGTLYGELDSLGFATVAEALDDPEPPNTRTRDHIGQNPDPDRTSDIRDTLGRRRADRLVDLCARDLHTRQGRDGTTPATEGTSGDLPPLPPTTLLATCTLDTLLELSKEPGSLLTTLAGGTLRLSADVARMLADQAGPQIRLVVLDDTGQIVGVGRKSRQAPGWLREAILARDPVCTAPGCRTAARLCDLDHARPWTQDGHTDVAELAPVCRTDHTARHRNGWTVTAHPDGTRRWRHTRTGLTTTHLPTTRPAGGRRRS